MIRAWHGATPPWSLMVMGTMVTQHRILLGLYSVPTEQDPLQHFIQHSLAVNSSYEPYAHTEQWTIHAKSAQGAGGKLEAGEMM